MQEYLHRDAQLIDALGGPTKLSRKCSALSGEPMTSQCVSNWRKRGIPPRWKIAIANMAVLSGLAVPENFSVTLPQPPAVDHSDIPEFLRRSA